MPSIAAKSHQCRRRFLGQVSLVPYPLKDDIMTLQQAFSCNNLSKTIDLLLKISMFGPVAIFFTGRNIIELRVDMQR
jgi:hypothetical protein